jgi:hypothetical protein
VAGICGGLILIAIPVIIGLVTLRKKAPVDMPTSVPPAI